MLTLTGAGFSALRWEAARRRTVARAFRTVPFYREQWAVAGRVLDEPVPVASEQLIDQLFRLCPLGRPFQPSREPTLWSDDGTTLRVAINAASDSRTATHAVFGREATAQASSGRRPAVRALSDRWAAVRAASGPAAARTVFDRAVVLRAVFGHRATGRAVFGRRWTAVLEVRDAMIDRRWLGRGVPYAALLSPKADVVNEERRAALNRRATELATSGAVIVGTRNELADVLPEIGAASLRVLHRAGLADALGMAGPVVAYDPVLGYYAARMPSCGHLHLLWRLFHARVADGALQLTALRRRRPVLCNVIPVDAAGAAVERCPRHHTPILTTTTA
ncbi:hypothetical protein ACGFNU_39135 [Spirillospora sp. NPDC048911]|uniref:hypothetical protein n=1 Tax=Spirillospora sp. NPDC048911 TaxID=3364527 RepID=UPI003720B5E2